MTGDEKHEWAAASTIDVLWVLYDKVLNVTPATVDDPDRDRFLLSKGHGPMAYYAVLAEKGFIDESTLDDWTSWDSPLGQHPDRVLVRRRGDQQRLARARAADRGGHGDRAAGRRQPRAHVRAGRRR